MRAPTESEFRDDLLAFRLNTLSDDAKAEIESDVRSNADTARELESIDHALAALDAARDVSAPADLAARVKRRIAAVPKVSQAIPFKKAQQLLERENARSAGRYHSLRDIAGIAAAVVLIVGVGIPGLMHARERAQRSACSSNLLNIGRGLQSYAAQFNDSLPFVGWDTATSAWAPTDQPNLVNVPNRQHVYPLLRGGAAKAGWFVCPSTDCVPMTSSEIPRRHDFLEARNLSYAYQNMSGSRPTTTRCAPDMVIMGDDNPLFDNGRPLVGLGRALGLVDVSTANSAAHRGAGENVLTIDGRVKWVTTPQAGASGDNIWTLQGVDRYTGREGPREPSDTHLIK
ncbi:MAG: DUF1559 domain-containing protein [Phycisphaerales bacterium]|nr:DUF1559 domain-containing protein [Phycisphaerales bacterium]